MNKKIIYLFFLYCTFPISNCMDWEDDYARTHWNYIVSMSDEASLIKPFINCHQYNLFMNTMNACTDNRCFLSDSTKALCFYCKSFYKIADAFTKNFINLILELQMEEQKYFFRYKGCCSQ
jgi:hypothetical protein